MCQLLKYKNTFGKLFIAAYVMLFTYSAFHFHKIDINTPSQYRVNDSPIPAKDETDRVYFSVFTCQFNIVYNSPVTHDFNSAKFELFDSKQYINAQDFSIYYSGNLYLLNLLRAPPVLS